MRPVRIQRQRTKGWKMPPNTVCVTRPGKYGNPFNFTSAEFSFTALAFGCRGDRAGRIKASVKAFREWVGSDPTKRTVGFERGVVIEGPNKQRIEIGARATAGRAPSLEEIRRDLRGKNLACFCALDQPCHADVLLELANTPAVAETDRAAPGDTGLVSGVSSEQTSPANEGSSLSPGGGAV